MRMVSCVPPVTGSARSLPTLGAKEGEAVPMLHEASPQAYTRKSNVVPSQ